MKPGNAEYASIIPTEMNGKRQYVRLFAQELVSVDAENGDRNLLIEHEAAEKGTPGGEVRRLQWRHWQRKSFPGEWIEVEGDATGEYRWVQKQGASEGDGEPEAPASATPDPN